MAGNYYYLASFSPELLDKIIGLAQAVCGNITAHTDLHTVLCRIDRVIRRIAPQDTCIGKMLARILKTRLTEIERVIVRKIDGLDARFGEILCALRLHCKDRLLLGMLFARGYRHLAVDQSQIVIQKDIPLQFGNQYDLPQYE